jgi:ADP-ribose pyrophosphatase YjhB (NUDIX family)
MSEDEARFSIAAYAVISGADGGVLLTRRRDGGECVLPGGSLEEAEAPWDAVAREVNEETGLQIGEPHLVGVYVKRRERDLVFVFRAAAIGGELRASEERDRVAFIDARQLPEETSERDAERVQHALAGVGLPILCPSSLRAATSRRRVAASERS